MMITTAIISRKGEERKEKEDCVRIVRFVSYTYFYFLQERWCKLLVITYRT